MKEIFFDKEGKKKKIKHQNKLITTVLLEPNEEYKKRLIEEKEKAKIRWKEMERERKIREKMREIAERELESEEKSK